MATHSSILVWKIPWAEECGRLRNPWGHRESDTTEPLHFSFLICVPNFVLERWEGRAQKWLSNECGALGLLA